MISVDFKLISILKISLLHDYYSDGISDHFLLSPDFETNNFLNRYKLVCKKSNKGIELFADENDCLTFKNYLTQKDEICLTFHFEATNAKLFQLTKDLKNQNSKEIIIVNNNKKNTEKVLFNPSYYKEAKSNKHEGIIEKQKNIPLGKIIYTFSTQQKNQINNLLSSKNTQESLNLELAFEAPESIWKYYLIKRNPNSEYNPILKSVQKKIKFKKAKKIQLNNKESYLIETETAHRINEVRDFRIELVDQIKKSDRTFTKTIIKNVPLPLEYSYISKDEGTYISNIIINI